MCKSIVLLIHCMYVLKPIGQKAGWYFVFARVWILSESRHQRVEKVFFIYSRKIRGIHNVVIIKRTSVFASYSDVYVLLLLRSQRRSVYFGGLICMCVSSVQDVYSVPQA